MKTFLISPVRGASEEEVELQEQAVRQLEQEGFEVHWARRDTNQDDPIGLRICLDNKAAIERADVVHVIWNGTSQGCLFDLGVAFALGKRIIPISLPPATDTKSFQNMISEWSKS